MLKRMSHPIIVCGLSSILAFGAVGCSSSSTTTTEISTTDEDGNTTTTTTTTSTDENGQETTETSTVETDSNGNVIEDADSTDDPNDFNGYTNDYYKIGFEIPEGYEDVTESSSADSDDNMQLEFEVADTKGNASAAIFLVPAVTSHEGITDMESWSEDFTNAFVKSLEDQKVENINTEFADFSIGGTSYGTVCMIDGNVGDATVYSDFYFVLDEDNDGFFVQLYAENEDDINKLRDSFRAL